MGRPYLILTKAVHKKGMPPSSSAQLRIATLSNSAEIVLLWRDLLGASAASVYQTPEFVLSWQESAVRADDRMLLLIVEDKTRPIMVMPLHVSKRGPLRIARYPAGKHSNFNMPVFDPAAGEKLAGELRPLLLQAARKAQIDLFALCNQPNDWLGSANPLTAFQTGPSPSFGAALKLDLDVEGMLTRIASKERRRKLRQKQKGLQSLGHADYCEATTPAAARLLLDAYLAQKAAQFEELGINNPFAEAAVQRWLQKLAVDSLDQNSGTLRMFGLKLDGEVIAVWGVGVYLGCASAMITSYTSKPHLARTSPGELLLEWVVRRLCAEGCRQLDFGVGEARYKSQWSDMTIPLFDAYIGVSMRGAAAATAMRAGATLKRRIKQSQRLSSVLKAVRRLRSKV